MNKQGNSQVVGLILFIGALAVFTIYMLTIYVPAIQANTTNSNALTNAVWWGIGCGIIGTIGALLVKR